MINFVFFASFLALGVAEKDAYSPYMQPQQQQHFFGGGYSQPQQQQHNYGGQQQHYGGGYAQHQEVEEKKDDGFSALTFQFEGLRIECIDENEQKVECLGGGAVSALLRSTKDAIVTDQCINKAIGKVSFGCEFCPDASFDGGEILSCTYEFATDYGDFIIEGEETFSFAADCDFEDDDDDRIVTIICPPQFCKATLDKKYNDEIKKVTLLSFSGISADTITLVESFNFPQLDLKFFVNVDIEKESRSNAPYSIVNQQPNHYGYQQPAQPYQRPPHNYQQPAPYRPQPAPYGPAQTYQRPAQVYQQPGATYGQQKSYKQPSTYQAQGGYRQQQQANTYQKPSSQAYQQRPAYGAQQQPVYGGGHNYNPQPVGYGGQPVYNPYQRH